MPTTGTKSPNADAYLWVGPTGSSWGSASNWSDTTTGTNPAPYVPGTLTPVTITGPTGSTFEVITGGGNAASVGLTGNVSLAGSYAFGGVLGVGSLAVTPPSIGSTTILITSSLALAAGSTITADSVNVVDGTLSLAGTTSMSSAGPVTVGLADDRYYGFSDGAINLAMGATLSTPGALSINSGTLNDTGGTVNVGGALTVGTTATSNRYQGSGRIVVTTGGTLTIGGAITEFGGMVVADGAGSKVIGSGTLTAIPNDTVSSSTGKYSRAVRALNGGFVQLGGVNLIAPSLGTISSFDFTGLYVDAASTIEVGTAGTAAAGTITVDAGETIATDNYANFDGALVNNGTVTVTGGTLGQNGNISGNGLVQIGEGARLVLYGNISGTGTLQIGKNATLALNGIAAATDTIAFLDIGATLSIGSRSSLSGATPYSVDATLADFQAGDSLVMDTPISAATYAAGSGGSPGTLTLSNGAATVETLHLTGDFAGKIFFISPTTNGGASISLIDGPMSNPVVSSPTLTVAENAASTALGIAAPTDPNYGTGQLAITATGLPSDGTVTLADGITAVVAGQALTSAQLASLRFKPTPGLFNTSSAFAYTVSDPANNVSTATATLAIGLPPTPKAEFDAAYYLQNNPDVAAAKVDPLKHFETYGWKEGRNPDAIFNVQYYLNQNPDVAAAKVNPLTHYETIGWKEGRDPSANFSTAAYLKANPDVAKAQIDPLKHYIEYGSREGRMIFAAQPHGVGAQDPLVDNAYYYSKYSDVRVAGANPFTDYDTVGWRQGRNPDALFDTNYYLQRNPDVKAAAIDPMLHYEQYGWKEGRDPSAQFSMSKYLAANPDVKAAGVNPLIHYEQYGIREGRPIFHV